MKRRANGGAHMKSTTLDLRGLKCPYPALRVRKALQTASPGEMFVVSCTDPMAAIDVPHLVNETGDRLELSRAEADVLIFHIRKTAPVAGEP
jgi:tRNA 2-thiouridine synthesizing protein A